jgi:hypothetical protein
MEGDPFIDGVGAAGRALQRKALPLATTVATANPKVRAGVLLLNAAEKNPAARRKVTHIVRRAQAGDPKAVSAVKTLRAAKVVKDRKKRRAMARARAQRQALAIQQASRPGAPPSGPRGLFKFWDRGAV